MLPLNGPAAAWSGKALRRCEGGFFTLGCVGRRGRGGTLLAIFGFPWGPVKTDAVEAADPVLAQSLGARLFVLLPLVVAPRT